VKVKICGLTNVEDAVKACEYGADLVGFIFVKDTPRYVGDAKDMIAGLPPAVKNAAGRVGLFKDEDPAAAAETVSLCGLDHVQLHGDETPAGCRELKKILKEKYDTTVTIIKTFKVAERLMLHGEYDLEDYDDADIFLFDTFHPGIPGGTGTSFDWSVLAGERDRIKKPFFIAGGLNPENVAAAVRAVHPYGVDTASGVESSPGKKDENLLKEFIQNAKKTCDA